MMTLDELWENLRQDPETKATMEEADKSYKLFKKIENLIVADLEAKLDEKTRIAEGYCELFDKKQHENYEQFCEIQELKTKLAESEARIACREDNIKFKEADINQLKWILEGKEKEIEELNKFMSDKADEIEDLKERISDKITSAYGAELMAKDVQWHLEKEIQELKQSQKQIAIKTIEKLKNISSKTYEDASDGSEHIIAWLFTPMEVKETLQYIDQQIKELRGEGK